MTFTPSRTPAVLITLHFVLLSVGAAGCAMDSGEGYAELGTGEWRFESVVPEQELSIVHGAQGGFHVWVSARASGIEPDPVRLLLETEPLDGSRPLERSDVPTHMEPAAEIDGMFELLGWPAVLAHPGCDVGKPIRISVTLTDTNGTRATAEEVIVPTDELELPGCDL